VEEDGETWLFSVQEFIEGSTLEDAVESGRHFTEAEARQVLTRLLGVLHDLHSRSPPLIHRDIKPSNVILDEDGSVHLVDFGSVRNVRDPEVLDGKTIVGTYGYMPIEQYEGRAVPQSDFYALGMTLIHLLSHKDPTRIPRTGLTLDFREHVNVSGRFADVLQWMVAAAPEDRPKSAEAILMALDSEALPALAPSDPEALRRWQTDTVASLVRFTLRMTETRRLLAAAGGFVAIWLAFFVWIMAGTPSFGFFGGRTPTASSPVGPAGAGPAAVRARDGTLTLDLDRDFEYVPRGWPMGRSAGQTTLPPLSTEPRSPLVLPAGRSQQDLLFGQIVLGNAEDNRFDFALASDDGRWAMHVDADNDEDLSDDGPPLYNEGTGPILATSLELDVDVRLDGSGSVSRPYALWIWFRESSSRTTPYGRMYARHHYRGAVELGGERYDATAFERNGHDALLKDDGVCIDLSRDGECQEDDELYFHGDVIRLTGGDVRLVLDYP